ncbi:glycoside hydrolase family 6 protein [Luedemannella flava]|uniref:Glucanase n=1 Tax=Luedemannella flava TaxID=349316 RepID=A0ABN2M9Q5_9ACTN
MRYVPLSGATFRARRKIAATAAVAALAASGALIATSAQALSPVACTYAYNIVGQWPGGFQAEVAVTSSSRVNGWTVAWTFAGDERINSGWNGTFAQSGKAVTVTNPSWQPVIEAGQTVRPGFVASTSATPVRPASVSLNGLWCATTGVTTAPPTSTRPTGTTSRPLTYQPTTRPPTSRPPTSGPASSAPVTSNPVTSGPPVPVTNPYAGAIGYRNPDFAARVAGSAATRTGDVAAAMTRVGQQPTGVWLPTIASVAGLRTHLNQALAQQAAAGQPVVVTVVLDNLPNRDCNEWVLHGELSVSNNGLARYRTEYVDAIAAVLRDPAYAGLRVATIIEPAALGTIALGWNRTAACAEVSAGMVYHDGIRYALNALAPIANVWNYLDASHSVALGYESNLGPAVSTFASLAASTNAGLASIDGLAINTAGYSPVVEPFLTDARATVTGSLIVQSSWADWNYVLDEEDYVAVLHAAMVRAGFPATIGIVIDTSRNGWGGTSRPTAVSTSTDLNTYVNQSRVDRRIYRSNWCNQVGAGIGERPRANPMAHVDAYIWAWEPGASDGAAPPAAGQPRPEGADPMCDPSWAPPMGSLRLNGSTYGAPGEGAWFDAYFETLVRNAYPVL